MIINQNGVRNRLFQLAKEDIIQPEKPGNKPHLLRTLLASRQAIPSAAPAAMFTFAVGQGPIPVAPPAVDPPPTSPQAAVLQICVRSWFFNKKSQGASGGGDSCKAGHW